MKVSSEELLVTKTFAQYDVCCRGGKDKETGIRCCAILLSQRSSAQLSQDIFEFTCDPLPISQRLPLCSLVSTKSRIHSTQSVTSLSVTNAIL